MVNMKPAEKKTASEDTEQRVKKQKTGREEVEDDVESSKCDEMRSCPRAEKKKDRAVGKQ